MGKVNIWDMTNTVKSLHVPGTIFDANLSPVHVHTKHSTEGFALDWSSRVTGRLLSGDCENSIYLTQLNSSAWTTESQAFQGHTQSVEDLQWSPSEENVFASCSVDQSIKIWDIRMKKKSALSVHAHSSDVNVITWNK